MDILFQEHTGVVVDGKSLYVVAYGISCPVRNYTESTCIRDGIEKGGFYFHLG